MLFLIIKLLKFTLFILAILWFAGCGEKVVYQKINIPVKCQIDMPTRPLETNSTSENIANILIYTEQLENSLNFCIN